MVADATDAQNLPHVRSNNSSLAALITRATEQSTTFRGLIDAINVSDGIVYVESGRCRYSRACLVGVTGLGGYRILRVSVVLRHSDTDLMAFIGHELQHAIEILSNPHVRNTEDMYLFYSRIGTRGRGPVDFETKAAIKAGDAVRKELRAFQSRTTGRAFREDRHYHSRPTEREEELEAPSGLNRRWRFCSRRGTKPQIIADDCKPPAIQELRRFRPTAKDRRKPQETAANGTNNGTKVTPPRRPDRTQPMGSVQAQSAGRRQQRTANPAQSSRYLPTTPTLQENTTGVYRDRSRARDDAFRTALHFMGDGEVRERESSCRDPAPSEWTAARQRASTAPSCWSSRALVLSWSLEGQSQPLNPVR